jgi:prevent-host-death family protein
MTRTARAPRRRIKDGCWPLQDAKARFSELVRTAKREGPQAVTVHGKEEVVVVSADEFRRLKGQPSGQALVDLLRHSPLRDLDLERRKVPARARSVEL